MHKTLRYISCILGIVLCIFALYTPALALTLTDNENVSVSAIVGSLPTIDNNPKGGSGSTPIPSQKGVRFSGYAYPKAIVIVQLGQDKRLSVLADDKGFFTALVDNGDSQLYTLQATDVAGRKSNLINFPTIVYNGYLTDITGVRFAPTIESDKLSMQKGDFITFAGSAQPNVPIEISFAGSETMTFHVSADATGAYNLTVPISLAPGSYLVRAKYTEDVRVSKALQVMIGSTTVPTDEATNNIPGDCNLDRKINIVDYSVLAYWFGKKNPPSCVDTNHDTRINLVDFSILAYYWSE